MSVVSKKTDDHFSARQNSISRKPPIVRMAEIEKEIDRILGKRDELERLKKLIPNLEKFGTEIPSIIEMERERDKLAREWPVLNEHWRRLRAEWQGLKSKVDEMDKKTS